MKQTSRRRRFSHAVAQAFQCAVHGKSYGEEGRQLLKEGDPLLVRHTTAARQPLPCLLRQGRYDQLETLMMSGAAQGMQTAEMAEDALRARGVLA